MSVGVKQEISCWKETTEMCFFHLVEKSDVVSVGNEKPTAAVKTDLTSSRSSAHRSRGKSLNMH